jgi:very-short-patch-repair endonuclease
MGVTQSSPAHVKIALFRSLFRGREDVHPRRFESRKTGKSGDTPACAQEWVRGVCEDPGSSAQTATSAACFLRMFDRRCRGYEAIGYRILLPASVRLRSDGTLTNSGETSSEPWRRRAILGWPTDVVLPSDPVWKRDYSGSVRRLVRDGVDVPLASLFVHAARAVPPGAEGAARARSATEAFLFRRLETLPLTKGRFALNARLPIAFDGQGNLEVDLLCAEARVAVELDGAQHLGDPVAYRRDRRKDLLLQENGYVVLRFLAEDVGKELNLVLDTILRSLTRRAV